MFPLIFSTLLTGSTFIPQEGRITVTIEGITVNSGILMIGLFDNPEDFTVKPLKFFMEPVRDTGSVTVTFENVRYGNYAVSVYQDKNKNGKLDKNRLGMPVEPYGFSNNPRIITGPSYDRSSFELNDREMKLSIRLYE